MRKVNKNSPLPLYYQLKENILEQIKDGDFKKGDKLPSERELAEYHDISRMTVKKAVDILVDSGYLYKKQGSGTYIASGREKYTISPLASFTNEMIKKGLDFKSKVIKFEEIYEKKVSEKFKLNPETEFYHLQRLRLIEDQPFLLENTYLPEYLVPNLSIKDLKNDSLYKILKEKYNIHLKKADAEIEAVILSEEIAEKMKLEEGMLGIYYEQFSRNSEGEIIEYTSAYYRNDNYRFKFTFNLDSSF